MSTCGAANVGVRGEETKGGQDSTSFRRTFSDAAMGNGPSEPQGNNVAAKPLAPLFEAVRAVRGTQNAAGTTKGEARDVARIDLGPHLALSWPDVSLVRRARCRA